MENDRYSWEAFREHLLGYVALDLTRRRQLLFRGQGTVNWKLQTTLDRRFPTLGSEARRQTYLRMLKDFQREMLECTSVQVEGEQLELLARHHGLPSQIIDWTESPYIAAYFAFAFAERDASDVAIWVLDRAEFPVSATSISIIDDAEILRFNPRAHRQRAVFLRADVDTVASPLEQELHGAVSRFEIKIEDRSLALRDLDEMRLNGVSLFGDLDGVAKAVTDRITAEGDT